MRALWGDLARELVDTPERVLASPLAPATLELVVACAAAGYAAGDLYIQLARMRAAHAENAYWARRMAGLYFDIRILVLSHSLSAVREPAPLDMRGLLSSAASRARAAVVSALLAVHLAGVAPAFAHDWYPRDCCSGRDCYPVADSDVAWTAGGWLIKATGEVVPHEKARFAPDGRFHRCSVQGKIGERTLCLFVPGLGS